MCTRKWRCEVELNSAASSWSRRRAAKWGRARARVHKSAFTRMHLASSSQPLGWHRRPTGIQFPPMKCEICPFPVVVCRGARCPRRHTRVMEWPCQEELRRVRGFPAVTSSVQRKFPARDEEREVQRTDWREWNRFHCVSVNSCLSGSRSSWAAALR